MPDHQPRVIDPAGIAPPPGEPLRQLRLPRPPRTSQHHHPLQPRRRLQLVEQVIAADEHAARRGQRIRRGRGLGWGGADLVQRRIQRRRPGRAGSAGLGEPDLPAQVVHRDQPVSQRHVPFRARPPVTLKQPPPPRAYRLAHAGPGEHGFVERGHELRRRDRVHAVGHRHHRRAPRFEQGGGHGGLQVLADRAGLARVQHHHRHPALGQHPGDLRRRHVVTAPAGLLERQHPLPRTGHHPRPAPRRPAARRPAGHHPVPVEMHHVERLARLGGLRHRLAQRVEGRGAQHGQVDLAADRVQPLQQRPGHHLIPHIGGPGRPGDHHQHPQLAARHLQRPRPTHHRHAPRDPARPQRHRPAAVPHQLPRQPQQPRLGRPEHHLQALIPSPLVRITGRPGAEHRPEHQVPPPGQLALHRRAAVLPHPERRQQVIL